MTDPVLTYRIGSVSFHDDDDSRTCFVLPVRTHHVRTITLFKTHEYSISNRTNRVHTLRYLVDHIAVEDARPTTTAVSSGGGGGTHSCNTGIHQQQGGALPSGMGTAANRNADIELREAYKSYKVIIFYIEGETSCLLT